MTIIAVIKYASGPSVQQRWSPQGAGTEHGSGRAQPAPRHAGQVATPGEWLWVPQLGGTSLGLTGAAVALLGRDLRVEQCFF